MAGAKAAAFSSVAIAMAFAGRSARACDVCASKNAHWFCAADDAFLCTACDTQVHSANAVSRRHERVRLSPNGTPLKASGKVGKSSEQGERQGSGGGETAHKKVHGGPAQVAPVRKRSRTTRPYSHHLKKLTQVVKSELSDHHHSPSGGVKAELELRDFLDADEFFVPDAGNQEVPNLAAVIPHDSPCASDEFGLSLPSDHDEFQEGDHTASADSFAVYFKGKAAHSQKVVDDGDQYLVPDAGLGDEFCNVERDSSPDSSMGPSSRATGDAFFFPGDIPGLDVGFESFVPDMDLSSDDFSLSFDLALQNANNGVETFEGDEAKLCKPKVEQQAQPHEFATGPFAKWFATKTKCELDEPVCAQKIRREAQAMLKCCQDGDVDAPKVPSLQLNMHDVLTAWSDRGEPWVDYKLSIPDNSISSDAGLVPDLDAAAAGDEQGQNGGDRDARVLRYKEKRRTRLFSKKIRYEVRKLNAERRPRMKGRFVKRTAAAS